MAEPSPERIAEPIAERIVAELARRPAGDALFVALDGRSGAGKTTVAAALRPLLLARGVGHPAVAVIEGDLFYAGGSATTWDGRSAAEKAATVIDWRRQRRVLADLRTNGRSTWRSFDWDSDDWDSDQAPTAGEQVETAVAPVVVLEGAYSARPELHDLLDLLVLLDTPLDVTAERLRAREGEEYRSDWEDRWRAAEHHYFGVVMPPSRFDLVI